MSLGKLESEHPRTGSALSETERERDPSGFFERSPLGLVRVSPDGRVQDATSAQPALLGCALTECVGQPLSRCLGEPRLAREILDISDTAKPR